MYSDVSKKVCTEKVVWQKIVHTLSDSKKQNERIDFMKVATKITQLFCQHEFSKPVSFGFDNYDSHRAIQHLQQTCVKCGKVKPFSRKVEKVYKASW